MSNYYKDCKITIKDNVATLDETLYLYKHDKNIDLYFSIKNKLYNLLEQIDADYSKIIMVKDDGSIKKIFPKQPLIDNKVHLLITEELTDEDIELGSYSFQIRLYNSTQDSVITLPIVLSSITILEPLFEDDDFEDDGNDSEDNVAKVGSAKVGLSIVG